jgi:putative nucleotidyltransferase with HDIG domain
MMLLSAVISIAVGLYCSTLLTRPLQLLTAQADALAHRQQYGHISVRDRTEIGDLARSFNTMADEIEHYIAELKLAAAKNRELFLGSIRLLAQAVDEKDPYTRGHSDRVARYSVAICDELNLSLEDTERINIAAQLHDVGKVVIDDVILKKTGRLTKEEFNTMKQHTTKGANIVRQVEQLRDVVPGIELHHEFLDGSGYPHGYRDEQIPLMAKIIAVADTFDAMTTLRPYQKPLAPSDVVKFIQSKAGTRYAPPVVEAFVAAWNKGVIRTDRDQRPIPTMTPAEALHEALVGDMF